MARNGSDGTYALADVVTPATLADANQVMTIFNDLKTAMTGSVASDGQTPITGQLKGLVSANPVYSFNGDSNTGLGSDTADEAYLMCGGTKIAKVSAAGLNVLSGALLVAGDQAVPCGLVLPWVGQSPYLPATGWILAHGGSIGDASSGATIRANADCANLFALIWNTSNQSGGEGQVQDSAGTNTARGANAAADFAAHKRILLPDFSDRSARGKGGATSHGQTAGADTVTVAQANLPNVAFTHSGTTLSDPTHAHTYGDPTHTHPTGGQAAIQNYGAAAGTSDRWGGSAIGTGAGSINITINAASTGISISAQGSAASGGSGTALNVQPKTLVTSFLIKL